MIKLLLLAVVLWIGTADAGTPKKLSCIPLIKGTAAALVPRAIDGETSTHIFIFCTTPAAPETASIEGFSCVKSECKTVMFSNLITTLTNGTARLTAINKVWADNIKWACDATISLEQSARGVMCKERTKIIEDNKIKWGNEFYNNLHPAP